MNETGFRLRREQGVAPGADLVVARQSALPVSAVGNIIMA